MVVFGAGATGSLFAARLSAVGHTVTAVGRPEHVASIRSGGLRVEGFRPGVFHFDARVRLEPGDAPDGVLLTVKTFDLPEAIREVGPTWDPVPPTLLPQNGLRVEATARAAMAAVGVPRPPLVRALATVPATLLEAGRIRAAGEGEVLFSGNPPDEARVATRWFVDLLRGAGVAVREVPDLRREEWRKTLVNAAINPITADHGVTNGRLAEDPWRGQALQLLHEARRAAALDGVEFDEGEAEGDLFRVVRATAENRSSMLQDLERGRPTEIAAISGSVLEVARAHGVDLPATRRAVDRIVAHVRAGDRRRAAKSS